MNFKKIVLLSLALCASFAGIIKPIEERWDWSTLPDTSSPEFEKQFQFPKDFQFGTAISCFQLNGPYLPDGTKIENSWTRESHRPQPIATADHWNHVAQDVQLFKKAGFTVARIGVDWSKIENEEGKINYQVLDAYKAIMREFKNKNIEVIVCLFHHVVPDWFLRRGSFREKENMHYFKKFAHLVRENLQPEGVHHWVAYNEPVGVMLQSYFTGKLPPSIQWDLTGAGLAVRNMFQAADELSEEFKEKDPQRIWGTVHIMQPLHPYHDDGLKGWLERKICNYFGYLTNEVMLDYYTNGTFDWKSAPAPVRYVINSLKYGSRIIQYPILENVNLEGVYFENPKAPESIDYMGINYYTHTLIKGFKYISNRPGEKVADGKAIYPEGLYWAIQQADRVKKPIMIMENGTSDRDGDKRDEYIKKHLWVVSEAIKNGYDIRGYHYWSALDHFSWGEEKPNHKKYGVYAVDFNDPARKRTLRKNALPFVNIMRKHIGKQPLPESAATA